MRGDRANRSIIPSSYWGEPWSKSGPKCFGRHFALVDIGSSENMLSMWNRMKLLFSFDWAGIYRWTGLSVEGNTFLTEPSVRWSESQWSNLSNCRRRHLAIKGMSWVRGGLFFVVYLCYVLSPCGMVCCIKNNKMRAEQMYEYGCCSVCHTVAVRKQLPHI